MTSRHVLSFLTGLSLLALAGCGQRDPAFEDAFAGNPGVAAVDAVGWDQIAMLSAGAEVKLDTVGHYKTSYNRCRSDGAGSVSLEQWNALAGNLNAVMAQPPLDKDVCKPAPRVHYGLDGYAEVHVGTSKRTIFDYRGGDICTNIPDPKAAGEILKVLNKVLLQAAYEDCGTPPADDHA
jgi:hypothetical protein